jgi:phosphotransferase system, enzyme I, PtsP
MHDLRYFCAVTGLAKPAMERDYLTLLRDVGESLTLLSGGNIDAFLERIVALVSSHIRTDVVSVYLYDSTAQELVLRATRGLAPACVGNIRLRLGEGLVGHVLQTLEPICEQAASQNPHFKYFPKTYEERFESFLAVPVHRSAERMGVLVAQRRERDFFGSRDVLALQVLASQLAGAIENARTVHTALARKAAPETSIPTLVRGRTVSKGYAYARAVLLNTVRSRRFLAPQRFDTHYYTLAEFQSAIRATEEDLLALEQRFAAGLPELATLVFMAHQMMLIDAQFTGAMTERIRAGENPPEAIIAVAHAWMECFAALPEPYLQDKAADIADLATRLLDKLVKNERESVSLAERILIARDLYPSDVLEFYAQKVQGIILTHGGETTHMALLARSLGIPLVIAQEPALLDLPEETRVLLDADIGNVYVDPPAAVVSRFSAREQARAATATVTVRPQTHTRDGVRVHLLANINLLSETELARELQAEGIGLYRSEFPFLIRPTFPSEEEQVVIYARLVQDLPERPIAIRTLDIGGDKGFGQQTAEPEENPQLGLRSIRFSLHFPEIFQQQLRAILRGGAAARDLRILFPMIGSLEEWRAAQAAVRSALASLAQDGLPHCSNPALGIMVEVPSAVQLMEEFAAEEIDFFCIGTNDLVQYLLGVDRGNEKVAAYYRPDHPAVLRSIHQVVSVAERYGRPVSLCGEMAHDLRFIPFFLGIGIRALSVDPRVLPALQPAIEAIDSREAATLAAKLLGCPTSRELETLLAHPGYGP